MQPKSVGWLTRQPTRWVGAFAHKPDRPGERRSGRTLPQQSQQPTLSIDGTCRLCRASGAIACRLAPAIEVRSDQASVIHGSGVVLTIDGHEFVGIDAVIEWLQLSGAGGRLIGVWLRGPRPYAVADRCYRWVAKHRHLI
ncbi:DCC1-like thiol-disulfide oxidoreductase family protein [Ferrimicrobium sp.]|uniref:DCC1-like thiol-disulfide oxidoreductase family protein n=1 Tax=Ferrimicrobium sp. TaxID=2926050 RepID=UPI0026071592|nr:DCC1-like thiol-disulfide oxidoreductase family protein [Ferrimicrobium sp.]